jgi:hypothetical protein
MDISIYVFIAAGGVGCVWGWYSEGEEGSGHQSFHFVGRPCAKIGVRLG